MFDPAFDPTTDHVLSLNPYGIASVLSLVHVSVCAGDARAHNPEKVAGQQSQLQRQHSPDSSAAASGLAAAITPAAEDSVSSRDVSAQSSPRAVCLLQPEQAVGDAQSMRSTGDAGPRVQGPPVDRAPQSVSAIQAMLPASDANSQQQYAAASQPLGRSSASADIVVPKVQGRAVVQSSAAVDGDQICLVEEDRQSMAGGQAHASAEEVASRVQGATADASPQVCHTASKGHAALATSPAMDAESAPANTASNMAAAAADAHTVLDADLAWILQHEEEINQQLLELGISESLGQSAVECVGGKTPLETRAGADKDSPWGRLPHKFSHVRSIKGEERHVAWLCV